MEFDKSEEKFEINEIDVYEDAPARTEREPNPEAEVRIPYEDTQQDTYTEEHTRHRRRRREFSRRPEKKNKYGWAFFLCSLFTGLGISIAIDAPVGLFVGMGVGFLFFVDPIYDKVMEKISNL